MGVPERNPNATGSANVAFTFYSKLNFSIGFETYRYRLFIDVYALPTALGLSVKKAGLWARI